MKQDLRVVKGTETKHKLLEAGLQILALEGFAGLSAKKVSDAAGVSKSNFFHHFTSAEEMTQQLFDYMMTIAFPAANAKDTFKSVKEFLSVLGDLTLNINERERIAYMALYHYYNLALVNPEYQVKIEAVKLEMAAFIKQTILQIEPNATKLAQRLDEAIELFVIQFDTIGMHFMLEKDLEKYKRLWALQSQMMLDYLYS